MLPIGKADGTSGCLHRQLQPHVCSMPFWWACGLRWLLYPTDLPHQDICRRPHQPMSCARNISPSEGQAHHASPSVSSHAFTQHKILCIAGYEVHMMAVMHSASKQHRCKYCKQRRCKYTDPSVHSLLKSCVTPLQAHLGCTTPHAALCRAAA